MTITPSKQREEGRVWIVDDSPLEAEHAKRALANQYDVRTFADGEAMLETLTTGAPPDVLVLDWNLPGMSGVELCRFVRSRVDEASLPILLVTSSQGQGSGVVEGLAAGANDYLRKPYEDAELRARIGVLVRTTRLQEATRLAAAQRLEFEQHLIGIVSHDLRNPLNAITLGCNLLLRRGALTEQQRSGVDRIQASAERASRMIRDLLDFTQARLGGGIQLSRGPVVLEALASQVVEEVRLAFPAKQIVLEASGQTRGMWDADRLAQAVTNLVVNACKYGTLDSPVVVTTRTEHDDGVIEVHNEGTPIPPEQIPTLFEPLRRGNLAPDSVARSIGLGLYIVKAVATAHHGEVSVVSSAPTGTTFTLRLPRTTSTAPAAG